MTKCAACLMGRRWECINNGKCNSRDNAGIDVGPSDSNLLLSDENLFSTEVSISNGYVPGKPEKEINTYKDDSVLRDQQSTGRKRAAEAYPLYPEEACEWRGMKLVGGNIPITGCIKGLQQARHHGPDKNTLNNEEGNVHRICHLCHNRWHTVNDPDYVWGIIHEPHSPTVATPSELIDNEGNWATRQLVKAKD